MQWLFLFCLVFAHFKVFHESSTQLMFIFILFSPVRIVFLHFPPKTNITKCKTCVVLPIEITVIYCYPWALWSAQTLKNMKAKTKPNSSYLYCLSFTVRGDSILLLGFPLSQSPFPPSLLSAPHPLPDQFNLDSGAWSFSCFSWWHQSHHLRHACRNVVRCWWARILNIYL